jgi:hypothetical protein
VVTSGVSYISGFCRHGVVCPQVAEGGMASNMEGSHKYILNKQLQTAEKGWSSNLGLCEVVTIPHHKKWPCYEMDTCAWGWTDPLA